MDFSGMMAAVFTPFNKDESVNYDVIPSYAEYLKKHGVDGIYVTGTTGEGLSLTTEEREKITEKWMMSAKKINLKAIIMIGSNCLANVKRLARHAESQGADGIAVLPSLYYKPATVDDLIRYCKEIASAAPRTSLFYYHIPFMTGVTLSMENFLSRGKSEIPTLRGMKFTHDDISGEGLKCLALFDKNFIIFSGFDQKTAEAIELDYVAAINCCFNFIPDIAKGLFDAKTEMEKDKDWLMKGRKRQGIINNIMDTIFSFTNGFSVSAAKTAMQILTGIDVGPPRKPLKALSPGEKIEMKAKLSEVMQPHF